MNISGNKTLIAVEILSINYILNYIQNLKFKVIRGIIFLNEPTLFYKLYFKVVVK